MLEHVDDLELVLPAQLLLADAPQVGDGRLGALRSSGDVELQDERSQNPLRGLASDCDELGGMAS
jgi:hypothetical protein